MSKKINVNPDHYKVAGRERQGENIVHEEHRERLATRKREERGKIRIPNQERASRPAARSRKSKTR